VIEALDRVEEFLVANRETVASAISSVAHQNFTASRDRMVEHMKVQNEHTRSLRSGAATKRALRDRLVQDHMRPISIVARAQLPTVGEFNALMLPLANKQFVAFVAAGYGMAKAAKVHEATFLAAGFDATFIDQLVAATDALKQATAESSQKGALRVGATEGLKTESAIARYNLRLLDAFIRRAIKDRVVLAQWRTIRRVAAAATAPKEVDEPSGSAGNTSSTQPGTTGITSSPAGGIPEVPAAA
jgi:hypothetical protein